MLTIVVEPQDYYDEERELFFEIPGAILEMEHSLVSLSKWESHYEKPFLSRTPHTFAEQVYYIRCMLLQPIEDPMILNFLTDSQLKKISAYIEKKHTATWFSETQNTSTSQEVVTSEVIYYWMVALNIPFETQHWNLGRLLTLIRVINSKNQPSKKMSKTEAAARARRLNKERLAKFNTTG